MLDTLRKNSKSALIYVFFAIIIVVFVFSFGPGSGGCRSGDGVTGATYAATVNGQTIPVSDFQVMYARVYRDYQSRAGGAFTEELARSIKLKDQVLDQMIDRELLSQAAVNHGIQVSDDELAKEIHKTFAGEGGAFDEANYRLIIERQLGMSVWQFEEQERRRLAAQKMIASVATSAKVSDDEVRAEFVREKEKLDLGFVRFAPAAFKAEVARPDDAAVDAFVKANGARLEEAYKSNSFRYHKPKRVKARHILVKVDERASDAAAAEAKKKLEDAKARIAGGADFAAEAKALSDDLANKDKGGDLGTFQPGAMDPMFEKAAFALKAGEVSEPVRTRFGWHLIKVDEVLPEETKTLKDVERELAAELMIDDQAKALAKKKADETLAQLQAGKTMEELWPPEEKKEEEKGMLRFDAGGTKPAASATGPFSPSNDYVPHIGMDAALSRAALALDEKSPVAPQVFEVNGSYFVIALKLHERPDLKELEAKMDEYREKARAKKSGQTLDAFVKALKEKAKVERNEALLYGAGGTGAAVDG